MIETAGADEAEVEVGPNSKQRVKTKHQVKEARGTRHVHVMLCADAACCMNVMHTADAWLGPRPFPPQDKVVEFARMDAYELLVATEKALGDSACPAEYYKELAADGIRNTALCPGFVDTPMTDFAKANGIDADAMIRPQDIAESVRFLLTVSPACVVPEIQFIRPGDGAF